MVSKFAYATIAALALVLTSCGAPSPIEQRLSEQPRDSDALVGEVLDGSFVEPDSVRFVGNDKVGRQYFVGRSESNEVCLIVYRSTADWGSACGPPGAFSVERDGIKAQLLDEASNATPDGEVVGDLVLVEELAT